MKAYSGPTETELRKALSRIVTGGLLPYNVAEYGGSLLDLEIVARRLPPGLNGDEDARDTAYTDALRSVLLDAVIRERLPNRRERRVLRYVLPLDEQYLGTTVRERRTAAGERLMDGENIVKADTIRTYYEPRALDALASALVAMEAEVRGEDISQPNGSARSQVSTR